MLLSAIVLNSRGWHEILQLLKFLHLKTHFIISFTLEKPVQMYWEQYNNFVPILKKIYVV